MNANAQAIPQVDNQITSQTAPASTDPSAPTPLIEVQGLAFSYGDKKVFDNVSFSLYPGEIMTILGKNGAGKSTLLDCIANLQNPQSGQVFLEGRPIQSIDLGDVAQTLAYVPQINVPAFSYSVRDYVVMGCAARIGILKVPGPEEIREVDEALDELGIEDLRGKICTHLSGGEFQQVQIARALVQHPRVILFDEPTNHLDYGNQLKILSVIHELAEHGVATIMTSHNPDHPIQLGGKVGMFRADGRFEVGEAIDIVTEERVREVYRVPAHIVYVPAAHRVACVSDGFEDVEEGTKEKIAVKEGNL